jgi:hypothetical protein
LQIRQRTAKNAALKLGFHKIGVKNFVSLWEITEIFNEIYGNFEEFSVI